MSESEKVEAQTDAEAAQFGLRKIYIKDLSFESPRPLEVFGKQNEGPEVNLELNTEVLTLEQSQFEVVLNITITTKDKDSDKVWYLIELKQAGIFQLANFPEDKLAVILNTYCPSILYPYAREAISSTVEKGGFPQFLLAPINFDAIYKQHLEKLKEAAAEDPSTSH